MTEFYWKCILRNHSGVFNGKEKHTRRTLFHDKWISAYYSVGCLNRWSTICVHVLRLYCIVSLTCHGRLPSMLIWWWPSQHHKPWDTVTGNNIALKVCRDKPFFRWQNIQNVQAISPVLCGIKIPVFQILSSIIKVVIIWPVMLRPHKHTIMYQHRAGTGPMLLASVQYRSSAGLFKYVCRGILTALDSYVATTASIRGRAVA